MRKPVFALIWHMYTVIQSGDTSFVSHTGRAYSDIDRNGKIDAVDYLLVKRMYLGTLALE